MAFIIPKLFYGLQKVWLTKVQKTKLDGFNAKCIRKIDGVQHSYWSRVTNVKVLSYVDAPLLSKILLEQQLVVFGKVLRRPTHDPVRKAIFQPTSDEIGINTTNRKRGRPKLSWAVEVRKVAMQISPIQLGENMGHAKNWKRSVRSFCRARMDDE